MSRVVRISAVVPVYNSEGTLAELVSRLQRVLEARSSAFEVILVNDGSTDDSWNVVLDLARRYPWVRGIRLMRNYGQHNAILCGIRTARHDVVLTLDDDLQHPPEEIPVLLEALAGDCDVVYGRPSTEDHGLWRDLASRITKLALRSAMGVRNAPDVSAFRAFRAGLRDAFAHFHGPFVSIDVLLSWATTRFAAVPVRHHPRRVGVSHYSGRMLLRHALDLMTGFSVLPLQLTSLMGFALTLLGLVLFVYVIGRYLIQGGGVPGFAFLASVIVIFSGSQLWALGIFGEYLARMHFRIMDRPAYAIQERTSGQVPEPLTTSDAAPHVSVER